MKPVIVNADSNFVFITYWWGAGNKNKNTSRPCPDEELVLGNRTKAPITFDEMIEQWKNKCRRAKCNYLVAEFPQFARKGMYQKAVNFKPSFILQALKACAPRAVVYIDGDMHVVRYPKIFDMPGIDFMARNWNIDPREYPDQICYQPYIFETSGGIQYFANTIAARNLLREWVTIVKEQPLKADDRLLAFIFNKRALLTSMSVVYLPIEYLWLTLDYEQEIPKRLYKPVELMITHPECLTTEDRAHAMGAAKSRIPPNYDRLITNKFSCRLRGMYFYEYIHFSSAAIAHTQGHYLNFMRQHGLLRVVPYEKRFGARNSIVRANTLAAKSFAVPAGKTVHILFASDASSAHKHLPNKLVIARTDVIPAILAVLLRNKRAIFVPPQAHQAALDRVKEHSKHAELVARNLGTAAVRYKKGYTLRLDTASPIVFNPVQVLTDLVSMSESLADLSRVFNSDFVFISRIRCAWIGRVQ